MAKKSQPAMRVSQASVARDEAAKIKALSAALGLGKPLPIAKKKVYVGGMNISDDFLESTAQIFDDLGKETGTTSFDSNAARTAIAFRKSQGPVLAAAQALVSLIEERIVSTYGGAGHSALQLYAKLKLQARELEASDAVKEAAKMLAQQMADHRRESEARNKAERAANALRRAEAKAAKAGATAGRKAAKSAGATK